MSTRPRPSSLGPRQEIIRKIIHVVPSADFSDPSWGIIDGDGWSIEVNIGDEEECAGFAFHVRGGNGPVPVIESILNHLCLRALDAQTGEFFVGGNESQQSYQQWKDYRDRAIGNSSEAE